eukprot:7101915-Prymnesium_polylepis.1
MAYCSERDRLRFDGQTRLTWPRPRQQSQMISTLDASTLSKMYTQSNSPVTPSSQAQASSD